MSTEQDVAMSAPSEKPEEPVTKVPSSPIVDQGLVAQLVGHVARQNVWQG